MTQTTSQWAAELEAKFANVTYTEIRVINRKTGTVHVGRVTDLHDGSPATVEQVCGSVRDSLGAARGGRFLTATDKPVECKRCSKNYPNI